jgi:D-alanyl-D-alanine carboxypeptidase
MRLPKIVEVLSLCLVAAAAIVPGGAKASEAEEILRGIKAGSCEGQEVASVIYFQTPLETLDLSCGYERPGGPKATGESRFLIASISKLFLAVAFLQQQERGVLGIDDPVTKWLPADVTRAFGTLDGVTIAHLLSMTSGIPDYLSDDFNDTAREMVRAGLSGRKILLYALEGAARAPRLFEPGKAFDYSNTNYLLAQLILERATGKAMHEVLRADVFNPAGLENTSVLGFGGGELVVGYEDMGEGLVPVDSYHAGVGFGDGGLVATAEDVARFYQVLFEERGLLTERSLERLLFDPVHAGYGLGVEVDRLSDGTVVVGHSGEHIGFTSDVRHVLGEDITAVILVAEAKADVSVTDDLLAARQ